MDIRDQASGQIWLLTIRIKKGGTYRIIVLTTNELLFKKSQLVERAKAIQDKADKEGRELRSSELTEFEEVMDEVSQVKKEIEKAVADEVRLKKAACKEAGIPYTGEELDLRIGFQNTGSGGRVLVDEGVEYRTWNAGEQSATGNGYREVSKIIRAAIDPRYKQDFTEETRAIYNTADDGSGGYLLPQIQSQEILRSARDVSVVASQCKSIELPNGSPVDIVGIDTNPTATWVGETGTIPLASITFRRLEMRPKKLTVLLALSNELARAKNALEMIEDAMRYAIANGLEKGILTGDGSVEPRGMDSLASIGSTDKSGAALTIGDVITGYWAIKKNNAPGRLSMFYGGAQGDKFSNMTDGDGRYLLSSQGGVPDIWNKMNIQTTEAIDVDTNDYATTYIGDFSQSYLAHVGSVRVFISKGSYDATNNGLTQDLTHIRVIGEFDWAPTYDNWMYRIYNASVA